MQEKKIEGPLTACETDAISSGVALALLKAFDADRKPGTVMTLSSLASSLDTTPEEVNRSLMSLQEMEAIKLGRKQVVINKGLLEKIAAECVV
jgi:hypothetical protein